MSFHPRLACLVVGSILGGAFPAQAYMAPQAYVEMRAGASHHFQLQVKRVDPPRGPRGYGDCKVRGWVARIFRDTAGGLEIGRGITIDVPCGTTGGKTPVGATAWQDFERLKSARVIEVYALGDGRRFRVADLGDGLRYLDAPTAAPTKVDGR